MSDTYLKMKSSSISSRTNLKKLFNVPNAYVEVFTFLNPLQQMDSQLVLRYNVVQGLI